MNIEIIAGSPRVESVSHRLALYLEKYLSDVTGHSVHLIDVRDWNLPVLQQHIFPSVEKTPDRFKPLSAHMFEANAFLLVTPEFNGSYTPALKNLFDYFPKQMHKAFGIATTSTGAFGGIRATQQLQLLVNALFGIASPQLLVTPHVDKKFDSSGNLLDPGFQKNIEVFITEFLWLAENLTGEMHRVL